MEIAWFEEKAERGATVIRERNGDSTEFTVTKENMAYLHSFVVEGYQFREKLDDPFTSNAPAGAKPRVHISDAACVACEG